MNFPVTIDQSPVLASGVTGDWRAPPIAAGEAFGMHVNHASIEYGIRKALFQYKANSVTWEELWQSRRRKVAIETYVALASYGLANEAVWTELGTLTSRVDTLAGLQEQVVGLKGQVAVLSAMLHNQQARVNNIEHGWTPLVVEQSGGNAIGEVPLGHPSSEDDVFGMTNTQIDELELQFNLPPGHFQGSDENDRRYSVMEYLTRG